MKYFLIIFIIGSSLFTISAQELVMAGRYVTALAAQSDSIIFFGTFEDQSNVFTADNGLIVNPDPIIFSFSDSPGTALRELQPIHGLIISPNPARQTVSAYRKDPTEKFIVCLYDQLGSLLFKSAWPAGENKLDLIMSQYAAGPYFLSVKNEEGTKGRLLKSLETIRKQEKIKFHFFKVRTGRDLSVP